MKGAPLQVLALVIGGWVCVRAALLVPDWSAGEPARTAERRSEPAPVALRSALPAIARPAAAVPSRAELMLRPLSPVELHRSSATPVERLAGAWSRPFVSSEVEKSPVTSSRFSTALEANGVDELPQPEVARGQRAAGIGPVIPVQPFSAPSRWSASAWAFVRQGGGAQLAHGGTLGGSQVGARISYRLNGDPDRPLAIVARAYAPTGAIRQSEAAVGVEWRPLPELPVTLLAERRQAVGREGRSAFAVAAYGGISDVPVAGPLHLDGYAQAGMVGARKRDLFADGSVLVGAPISRGIKAGAGLWGAAQPGASRLDIGPQASITPAPGDRPITLRAEWRFRVAGDAKPGSGPALTLSTGF